MAEILIMEVKGGVMVSTSSAQINSNSALGCATPINSKPIVIQHEQSQYKKLNRFSESEKKILYALFKQHQNIIDIKRRKSSYSSHKQSEVRSCWELILKVFNERMDTKKRTMRQIQKFWLNSK